MIYYGGFHGMIGLMIFKRYADDYETVTTVDDSGREIKKVVYRGKYYEVDLDEAGMRVFKRTSILIFIALIVAQVAGGFVDNQGMYQFYVALPYVFAFFPLLYIGAGVLRLPGEKRMYRRDEVGLTYERMKTSSRIMLSFLLIGLVGEVVFILFVATVGELSREFIYLAINAVSVAMLFYSIRRQNKIQIRVDGD